MDVIITMSRTAFEERLVDLITEAARGGLDAEEILDALDIQRALFMDALAEEESDRG